MEDMTPEEFEKRFIKQDDDEQFPIADLVSLESVVNILLRKGICTPEELYREESRRRQHMLRQGPNVSVVQTVRELNANDFENQISRKKMNWLKKLMAKQRWSRRLGTKLFGWEWKKVKTKKEVQSL